MSKVININPIEELKKTEMADLIAKLQSLQLSKLEGLFIAFEYDGVYDGHLIGMDFGLKGYIDARTQLLSEELLAYGADEEDSSDLS